MGNKKAIFISGITFLLALGTNIASADYGNPNYRNAKGGYICNHPNGEMCMHHKGSKMWGQYKGKPGKNMHGMKYMTERLGLSQQQMDKMQAIRTEKRKIMLSIRKEMYELNKTINALDPKSPDFKNQIFSLAEKKGVLAQRLVVEKGEMRFNMASILTDEQLAKRRQIQQDMMQMKRKMPCHNMGKGYGMQRKGVMNTENKNTETKTEMQTDTDSPQETDDSPQNNQETSPSATPDEGTQVTPEETKAEDESEEKSENPVKPI